MQLGTETACYVPGDRVWIQQDAGFHQPYEECGWGIGGRTITITSFLFYFAQAHEWHTTPIRDIMILGSCGLTVKPDIVHLARKDEVTLIQRLEGRAVSHAQEPNFLCIGQVK